MTEDAQLALTALEETLRAGLALNTRVQWGELKDHSAFTQAPPAEPKAPTYPPPPDRLDYRAKPSLLDRLFGRVPEVQAAARAAFDAAEVAWQAEKERIDRSHARRTSEYGQANEAWHRAKRKHEERQHERNTGIDRQRADYEQRKARGVEDYFDIVLNASEYPDWMPQDFNLEYRPRNKTILVDYSLPTVDSMPRLREVSFVASRGEMKEKVLTDAQARRLYDLVIYQLVLRSVHEMFTADYREAIGSVAFNGYVTAADPTTGRVVTTCILSLHVAKDEFEALDLANVDAKACFKSLKGVGSSQLHSVTAVAPIMEMNREDARFVGSRGVAHSLDEGVNLASMDWQDFEHLTRELFESEFSSQGGEVKVTQSSRDGGVDAIAFDPDPIRGGKIVIQAKRYTNTVGVAAVRDLYGTVLNEGATKGILVTTSDYGPDAYRFAKDKPLTLMNGANLLHLLERHGHRARIDVGEAKHGA